MSIRLRNKAVPDKWYIIVEGNFTNKKGKLIKQRLVKFDGSRAEALVADADLNGKEQTPQYPTILEMLPNFLKAYQNNSQPRSYDVMQNSLNHLLPYYGEMRIPLIINFHHETYKTLRLSATYLPGKPYQTIDKDTPEETEKRKPISKSTINRELACLNAMLTFAERDGVVVGARPDLFNKKQAEGKAIIPLAPSQLIELLKVAIGSYQMPIMLMAYTGLRLEEATYMKCADIHLENRTMYVTGKGGATQAVSIPLPMVEPIRKAKESQTEKGIEWLSVNPKTGKPYGDIMKHLNTLCASVKIDKKITHHTLRHSCATALVLAGVALPRVQGILRHANIETTMLYVHIAAHFGVSKESELARKLFWLNADGIEEAPALDFKAMAANGPMYPDSYVTDIADIAK
jgi:site-specific recombinase XerD